MRRRDIRQALLNDRMGDQSPVIGPGVLKAIGMVFQQDAGEPPGSRASTPGTMHGTMPGAAKQAADVELHSMKRSGTEAM
jgi:hypothetical protein